MVHMSRNNSKNREFIGDVREAAAVSLAADYVLVQREVERDNASHGHPLDAMAVGIKVHQKWKEQCEKRVTDGDLKGLFEKAQVSAAAREGRASVAKRFDLRLLAGTREYVFETQA